MITINCFMLNLCKYICINIFFIDSLMLKKKKKHQTLWYNNYNDNVDNILGQKHFLIKLFPFGN